MRETYTRCCIEINQHKVVCIHNLAKVCPVKCILQQGAKDQPNQTSYQMFPQTGQSQTSQMDPQSDQHTTSQMYPTGGQGTYQQPMQGDAKQDGGKYMNYHVQAKMKDGTDVEGIITHMDDHEIEMLVPEEVDEEEINKNRQQYGYGGGYGRRRFRRFRRHRFPFLNIVIIRPFPYYHPY